MTYECDQAYEPTLNKVFVVNYCIIYALECLVAFCTSIVIFCCRRKSERPRFVVIQTSFLIVYCIIVGIHLGTG